MRKIVKKKWVYILNLVSLDMTIKSLPKEITSYDLLKTFAVITMLIDHMGSYFFPDEAWLRAIGRLSFPVWFFLVGYARSRDFSPRMFLGAGLLAASSIPAGMAFFSLNILVSILVVRALLDPVMTFATRNKWALWGVSAALICALLPAGLLIEYGSVGLMMAMFGYLVRRRDELEEPAVLDTYMTFLVVVYGVSQILVFGFSHIQSGFVILGSLAVLFVLSGFKPVTYSALSEKSPVALRWFLQFCGRRTLEIYVVHLLVFRSLAVYWGYEGYEFMDWSWFE